MYKYTVVCRSSSGMELRVEHFALKCEVLDVVSRRIADGYRVEVMLFGVWETARGEALE